MPLFRGGASPRAVIFTTRSVVALWFGLCLTGVGHESLSRRTVVEYTIQNWCAAALEAWQNATLVDYAHVVLGIVVLGWFVARYFSSR